MRSAGATWRAAAEASGLTYFKFRVAIDPEYGQLRRASINARRRRLGNKSSIPSTAHRTDRTVSPDEAIVALASVPADDRSLTGRLLGDPLPGRSALDRKGGAPC
jgi:hypothetical protein